VSRGMPDFFGLPGIFDNVRDGLVLVRFPKGQIVLFNRAAGDMSGRDPAAMLGTDFKSVLIDPELQGRAQRSASQAVGEWPGHAQDTFPTDIRTAGKDTPVEVSICRVEDAGTGGPLVLFVMRPSADVAVEAAIQKVAMAQPGGQAA